jgi:tetrahydromethanopterin S-methyltransferase subunit G
VDAEALVKALAQQKIEEKKEEVMQKAGKEIEKKLGTDVLKGLFGK